MRSFGRRNSRPKNCTPQVSGRPRSLHKRRPLPAFEARAGRQKGTVVSVHLTCEQGRQLAGDGVEAHRRQVPRARLRHGVGRGEALWNAKTTTEAPCVAAFRNWIWNRRSRRALVEIPAGRCGMADQARNARVEELPSCIGGSRAGHAGRRVRDHVGLELVAAHGGPAGSDLEPDANRRCCPCWS